MIEHQVREGGIFLLDNISSEEVFTPEDFTDEHRDIARAVEDFIKGEITERGDEIEELNYELSRKLMKKAGELGFLGIDISEKFGGMGLDKISSAIVSEKFGYGAGSFTITELNHTGIGTLPVALFGTEEQRKKYLPGLSSGDLIGAFGLTEPEAGSDALNPRTIATLSEDGKYYILNGSKQFITNAGFADVIFVYAKVDGKDFTAFIVEQNWEGVSTDEEENKMGMHGTSTRAYHFENVKVPVENVLGEVGRGHIVALNALNMGRFKVGAICIGSAKRAFYEAINYAKQRVQFGKSISEFGMIKEKIAKMAIRLFIAESMMYRTAGLIQRKIERDSNLGEEGDEGIVTAKALEEYIIECSINKVFGSETEDFVVDEELQIFGGYGYIKENHPELAYRNARINRIWEGTNEINRLVLVNTFVKRFGKRMDVEELLLKTVEELRESKLKKEADDNDLPLEFQRNQLELIKKVFLFTFLKVYKKFGKNLRNEEEFVRMLADIVIDIWGLESGLLRALKIVERKSGEKSEIPVQMIQAFFHDTLDSLHLNTISILGALSSGNQLKDEVSIVRKVLLNYPDNIIGLRKDIADYYIRRGRYVI